MLTCTGDDGSQQPLSLFDSHSATHNLAVNPEVIASPTLLCRSVLGS